MKTLKPEIKSWDCVENDPIGEWIPDDPSEVEFWLNITVGIEGEDGADNFLVHVVTEKALSGVLDKSYLLVIPYYEDFNYVLSEINSKLEGCSDIDWLGMSSQISKLFQWEYEGMK